MGADNRRGSGGAKSCLLLAVAVEVSFCGVGCQNVVETGRRIEGFAFLLSPPHSTSELESKDQSWSSGEILEGREEFSPLFGVQFIRLLSGYSIPPQPIFKSNWVDSDYLRLLLHIYALSDPLGKAKIRPFTYILFFISLCLSIIDLLQKLYQILGSKCVHITYSHLVPVSKLVTPPSREWLEAGQTVQNTYTSLISSR